MKIQSIKCTIHRDANTKKQVIPLPAMEVAGLERTEALVFHAQEGCILVGRTDMTAGEAIRVLTYSGGSLGTLKIPTIDLSVKIYQGTGSGTLAKGAGHFTDTSIWDGTVALAGHNRGVNNHFGKIHTLELGDKITLTTKLGTRTYQVTSVSKISETDRSAMTPTGENRIVLYTCVMNQSAYRWCVQAVAD